MKKILFGTVWVTLVLLAAACGGSSNSPAAPNSTTPTPTQTPSPSGPSVSFRMDGNVITATNITAALTNGIMTIGAGNASSNVTLSFAITPTSAGVGTYTLGTLSSANALLLSGNPAQSWQAGVGIGSGTITLNTYTSTGASGTFSFSMAPLPGATGTKAITEGVFNVTFSAVPAPAPTPSTSSISASIDGVAWSGSLSRRATLGNNLLTLTGQDTSLRVITLVLPVSGSLQIPPSQPFTISLTLAPSPFGQVTMVLGSSTWDNGHAGGEGTATITSISSTHVSGTFSVTLVNNPINVVAVPTAHVTSGQFDMTLERF